MDSGSRHRRRDARREVAIRDQANARARLADIGDQLLVARPVEDHDHQVVHPALQPPRDGLQILLDRRIQIHRAFGGRADDDLLHVAVRRVQQPARLGGRQHRDGPGAAGGAEIGSLQRIDRDIHA